MQWLTPSIIATLVGTILLAGVYFYLYYTYRHDYLLIWLWAWGLYGSRFVFELIGISSLSILVTIVTHSVTLLSGILLLWGTFRFTGRPFSHVWIVVGIASVAWITISSLLDASFLLITAPSFTLLAGLYVWTGLSIIRSEIGGRTSRLITGMCFILWGIHKADFPFLRTVAWFAPWGFLLGAALEITVALGMLLIFFETLQLQLASRERTQRAILRAASNVSFIITDAKEPEPSILEFSPGAEQIFGYTRDEMLGRFVSVLHLPEDVAQFPDVLRNMREGKPGFSGETRLVRKSGEVFPAMFSTYPLFDEKEMMYAALGVSLDISRRKQDEEELKRLVEEKNILLAEVNHRVKNNMQVIISLLGLQASEIGDKRLETAFQESRNRIESMRLVHEQLYRSREYAHIDFGEYVDQLITALFNIHNVEPKQVQVKIDANDIFLNLETAIPCGLLLNEIITNSLKYAFPVGRKGKIWIKFVLEDAKIVLLIGDDGVGILDDMIFAEPKSLGLQLVQILVTHDLQGNVILERDKGTQFHIEFPVSSVRGAT